MYLRKVIQLMHERFCLGKNYPVGFKFADYNPAPQNADAVSVATLAVLVC